MWVDLGYEDDLMSIASDGDDNEIPDLLAVASESDDSVSPDQLSFTSDEKSDSDYGGILDQLFITSSEELYSRLEYQSRGSAHVHNVTWACLN